MRQSQSCDTYSNMALVSVWCAVFLQSASSYYLSQHRLSWTDSQLYCQNICGSSLANIPDATNFASIRNIISNSMDTSNIFTGETYANNIWIGLSAVDSSNNMNNFSWVDSSSFIYGFTANVSPWTATEPQFQSSLNCVQLLESDPNYLWSIQNCTEKSRFLCNDCFDKIDKFLLVQEQLTYTNAQSRCNN
eukprot:349862_1